MLPGPQPLIISPLAVEVFRRDAAQFFAPEFRIDGPANPGVIFEKDFRAGADGILFV